MFYLKRRIAEIYSPSSVFGTFDLNSVVVKFVVRGIGFLNNNS